MAVGTLVPEVETAHQSPVSLAVTVVPLAAWNTTANPEMAEVIEAAVPVVIRTHDEVAFEVPFENWSEKATAVYGMAVVERATATNKASKVIFISINVK